MSLDLADADQLEPYDDEEIQLMDMDETNLQADEQLVNSSTQENKSQEENQRPEKELDIEREDHLPSLLVIEKIKVYIRDGPSRHHVDMIPIDQQYYELPTVEQLTSIQLTEDKLNDIWQSLDLTKEDFRTESSSTGRSRPESLYVRGVNKMSTQEIFNYFENFEPHGIEWISDQSCNVFWNNTLTPINLLATMSKPGPCVSRRRPVDFDHAMRLNKRKSSSLETNDDQTGSFDVALPPGHWREATFHTDEKPGSTVKLYVRYTTINDRKSRGAENQSEYYRQYGNPNYNNMTGLISRSKKRTLNAMKSNRFRDFTVVKSQDIATTSSSVVEEISTTTTDDNTTDSKVKFTVILPPKSSSAVDKDEETEEESHRSKRQRRRSWDEKTHNDNEKDRKEKPHFTVTLDATSENPKHSKTHRNDTPKFTKDDDDDDHTPITDARQILDRKRRNRR